MSWRDFKLKGYLLQNYERPWFDLLNLLDRSVHWGIEALEGDSPAINTTLNDAVIRRKEAGRIRRCFCEPHYNVDLTHFRNHVSLSQTWLHGTAVHQRAQSEGAERVVFTLNKSKTKRLALFDKRKQCQRWRNGVQIHPRTGKKSRWRRRCSPAEEGMATWADQETARLKARPQISALRREKRQSSLKELLLSSTAWPLL